MSSLSHLPLLLLSLLSTFTAAQSSSNASAVFVYDGSDDAQFVFALNADKSTGDLYFHLSSPAGNSWVGVGIGDEMKDALFFIAYPASNGNDVTISPRIGSGNTEPTYQPDLTIDLQSGNGLTGANTVTGSEETTNIVADGVCRGCAKWDGGSIDLTNTQQQFIFAVGPVFPPIDSNSLSAGLSRHMFYGHFTMDMTAATSSSGGSVPVGPYTTKNAPQTATGATVDNDPAPRIHGAVMSVVFIIAFPLGSLLLRVWHKVRGHIIVQVIGLVLFCMAFAGGCVVSLQYNRSKHFNSAHQVIGILLLIALFAQLGLGAYHHRIYKREQRKTIFGKIHLYMGPAIMLIGIINGYLGFSLLGARMLAIPYTIIILIFAAIYFCIRGGTHFYRKRRNGAKNGPEGYQYPMFGGPTHVTPPGAPPPYVQQEVPLQRFESSQSVPRADSPAVQPRNMV